jgi:hypothetical protein
LSAVRSAEAAGALIAAAAFAAAELAIAILAGHFFALGRAEALLFLTFRPALLLVAALLIARWRWQRRLLCYAAALAIAAASETILLLALGARDPWPEMLRGLAGGAAAAALADLLLQAGRRWKGRLGSGLAALVFALLFLAAGARAYESLVLGATAPRPTEADRPPLLLMTSLPIVWGESGAFDPSSRPAESYRLLEREFDVRPIDSIEPATLAGARLLLLAQPRLLAPEELATLDAWVRGGGRALVLTDPRLVWPSLYPPGDARRPPAAGLLLPLLSHWGLRLDSPVSGGEVVEEVAGRRLRLAAPGGFAVAGPACRAQGLVARCAIGRGEALLVADADLLADRLWTAEGIERGAERHLRTADNGLVVADWLDRLSGRARDRRDLEVAWIAPDAERGLGLFLAALPLVLALVAGLALRRLRRL